MSETANTEKVIQPLLKDNYATDNATFKKIKKIINHQPPKKKLIKKKK